MWILLQHLLKNKTTLFSIFSFQENTPGKKKKKINYVNYYKATSIFKTMN